MTTADAVLQSIQQDFEAGSALRVISEACGGDCYVVGGVVRDSLVGTRRFGDLDIMVNNGDNRAFRLLDNLGVPFEINRRGNRRYFWNHARIDLFEPAGFYRGFDTVEDTLAFFDLKVNALGIHLLSKELLDPLHGVEHIESQRIGINWPRWRSDIMSSKEYWILLIRLVRIVHNAPSLMLGSQEAEGLKEVVRRLDEADWPSVRHRFPLGREVLLRHLGGLLTDRVAAD